MSVTLLFPVLRGLMRRAFRLGAESHERVVRRIEALLSDMEARLSGGRGSILGGEELSFVDITLASLSGLWLQPPAYGAGKAEAERFPANLVPAEMLGDMDRWRAAYPDLTAYVERLYRDERMSGRQGREPAPVRRGPREADPA
jgi:glutathione S-transferase